LLLEWPFLRGMVVLQRAFDRFCAVLGPRAGSAEARYAFGVNAALLGFHDRAEGAFREAIELKPDYWWAHYCLGLVLGLEGRQQEGTQHLERALVGLPGAVSVICALGRAYLREGDSDRAAAQFRAALEIEPEILSALRNLGTLHLKAGRHTEAIACLQRALALAPDHASTLRKIAIAYLETGDQAKAEAHMRRALEIEGQP
jgi:tetratricopeptide (TPR) repeat protein